MAAALSALFAPEASEGQVQDLQPIFSTGFETGTLGEWPAASADGGDLAVTGTAALAGSFGLQAVVNDASGLYVQDDLTIYGPWFRNDHDSYYQVSFRFDPNEFDPGEAQGALRTRIFIAFEDAPSRRLFALVLRRRDGQFALMARVRQDDDSQVDTGFFDITDDPHLVQMIWHRSHGPDAGDGMFRLAIDSVVVSTLQNLDNAMSGIDFTRLGAMSVKNGASGTLYWDDYQSFRDLVPARAQLIINEVDYDQPGADTQEFVEIYNRGPAGVELSDNNGYVSVVYIDGATHYLYGGFPGYGVLAAGQYMVFASRAVSVAPGARRADLLFDQDNLGNGAPEGLVLVYRTGIDCEVLDALSYEGPLSAPLAPDCGLIEFVEGTMLSADIEDSDLFPGSLIRHPNGSDTNDASTDWLFSATPTPGSANVP